MFIADVGGSGGSQSNRISNSPFLQNYIIFYNNIYKLFSKHKIYYNQYIFLYKYSKNNSIYLKNLLDAKFRNYR